MTGLKTALMSACAAVITAGAAYAVEPVEFEVSGSAAFVGGVSQGEAAGDVDADVEVKGSTFLDNGIELGGVINARLDGQQPSSTFGGGRYTSLLIGGPRGIAPLTSDAFLQGAYAYARGGFGQVIVGRDQGVARTLAVTSPTIFKSLNVNDWRTDLSGINDVHTVNDFTGHATKLSYLPPANFLGGVVGGLQLGVSYSPSLSNCGDRLCAPESSIVLSPDGTLLTETSSWEDAVEAALYYQTGFNVGRSSERLLLGVGASYVTADEDAQTALPIFDDYEAYSVGLNLAYRGITIGGSVKTTNAGLAATAAGDDGYLAFDAGVTCRTGEESGDVAVMLGFGQSEANVVSVNPFNPVLFRDTQTTQVGVSYVLSRGISIGAAAQYVESRGPAQIGGDEEATTVVIESSIKF